MLGTFSRIALVVLALWVVTAGAGLTTLPGAKKRALQKKIRRQKAVGAKWNSGFVQAPSAEDNLAFPAAIIQ